MKTLVVSIGSILLLSTLWGLRTTKEKTVSALPFYKSADFTPLWLDPSSEEVSALHTIPPFSFTDQRGKEVTGKTFEGKIYVADFFFTSCGGICPVLTERMKVVQKAFVNDSDIMFLSHSVTPQQDSVPVLKAYEEEHGILYPQWRLVTGEKRRIYEIARKAYFADETLGEQRSENDFLHSEHFLLIDKHRHIRGIYSGTSLPDMQRLIEDIRLLKAEA